jgi:hypothetical protein
MINFLIILLCASILDDVIYYFYDNKLYMLFDVLYIINPIIIILMIYDPKS